MTLTVFLFSLHHTLISDRLIYRVGGAIDGLLLGRSAVLMWGLFQTIEILSIAIYIGRKIRHDSLMALNLEAIKRAADRRERQIMKLHSQGWTMRELGVRFEITFQRVQQIISRAKRTQQIGKEE